MDTQFKFGPDKIPVVTLPGVTLNLHVGDAVSLCYPDIKGFYYVEYIVIDLGEPAENNKIIYYLRSLRKPPNPEPTEETHERTL